MLDFSRPYALEISVKFNFLAFIRDSTEESTVIQKYEWKINALCMSGVTVWRNIFHIYKKGSTQMQFSHSVHSSCTTKVCFWHSGAKIWGKKCNLRCSEDWNRCDICLLLHIFKSVIFVFIFSENWKSNYSWKCKNSKYSLV